MKRRSLLPGVALPVLLLVAFSPVQGDAWRPDHPPSVRVTIDGKSFVPGDPGQDDFSPVRREFERFGVEIPPQSGVPAGDRSGYPAIRGRLVGVEGPPTGAPSPLPQGLTAEHSLRLETPAGSTDLVLGRMHSRGASIRNRLAADGWEGHGQVDAPGLPWLLEKRTRKETTVVCLDEAEGTFLLFRETDR